MNDTEAAVLESVTRDPSSTWEIIERVRERLPSARTASITATLVALSGLGLVARLSAETWCREYQKVTVAQIVRELADRK